MNKKETRNIHKILCDGDIYLKVNAAYMYIIHIHMSERLT